MTFIFKLFILFYFVKFFFNDFLSIKVFFYPPPPPIIYLVKLLIFLKILQKMTGISNKGIAGSFCLPLAIQICSKEQQTTSMINHHYATGINA